VDRLHLFILTVSVSVNVSANVRVEFQQAEEGSQIPPILRWMGSAGPVQLELGHLMKLIEDNWKG